VPESNHAAKQSVTVHEKSRSRAFQRIPKSRKLVKVINFDEIEQIY